MALSKLNSICTTLKIHVFKMPHILPIKVILEELQKKLHKNNLEKNIDMKHKSLLCASSFPFIFGKNVLKVQKSHLIFFYTEPFK